MTEVLKGATGHWSEIELRIVDLMLNGLDEDDVWAILPGSDQFDTAAVFAAYEKDQEHVEAAIRDLFDERPPARHARRSVRKLEL